MPIKLEDWPERFLISDIPTLPCPHCGKGRMAPKKPGKGIEPGYSQQARDHDAWEPHWISERHVLEFHCSEAKCGEVSLMICDSIVDEAPDDQHGWIYESYLIPKVMFPAAHLFQIPADVPELIAAPLIDAFGHYWGDEASSANKLRISVEALMDHWAIPKSIPTKKNRNRQLSLQERIVLAGKRGLVDKDALEAVKWVGNVGSHESGYKIPKKTLVEVMEVYEDVIQEEFVRKTHKAKLKATAKQIIAKKGK